MRKFLLTAAAVCGVFVAGVSVRAADEAKSKSVQGVLIDTTCGAKQMNKDNPEQSAVAHPKTCVQKCVKNGSGLSVISGKKIYALDEKGTQMANKYLEVAENGTRVVVVGTVSEADSKITVTEIKPAGEKSEGEQGKKS